MYRLKYFLLLILSSTLYSHTQNEKINQIYDVIDAANRSYLDQNKNIDYLTPLNIIIQNKRLLKDVKDPSTQTYMEFLNTAYSYVHFDDSIIDTQDRIKPSETVEVFDPIPFLTKEIGDKRVVMLNEAHSTPGHRLFAESMLKTLKEKGFKYLAVETLSWSDTLINQRGYPISTTGYYSREPYFANFLRTAIKEGFTIIPYDQQAHQVKTRDINERETNQANNLISAINENPTDKIFVYAGYAHIQKKSEIQDIKWMAERFKDSTGIDPFTIDQTKFTSSKEEKLGLINLNANNDSITDDFKGTYDVAIVNSQKEAFQHLNLGKQEIKIQLSKNHLDNNILLILQAYIIEEYKEFGNRAIPFDQKLLLNEEKSTSLYLMPYESYFLIIKDEGNHIILKKEVKANGEVVKL